MSIFSNKKKLSINDFQFRSRADAFNSMLAYLIEEKGVEPMEAAKQANEFAEIFSANMGIPLKQEPELRGVDKYLSMADKIGNYIEQHPKVIEYGVPALTFIVGLFTGKKVEQHEDRHEAQEAQTREKIDFDNIPD